MKNQRWSACLVFLLPIVSVCQQIIITSPTGASFSFGVDSIFYSRRWHEAVSIPVRKENSQFFVLLRGDSSLFVKKIPKSADIHHFVLEKSNSGSMALFYRGILSQVPDTITAYKESTDIHLSSVLHSGTPRDVAGSNLQTASPHQANPTESIADSGTTASVPIVEDENHHQPESEITTTAPGKSSPPFDQTVKKIQSAEFEFERMLLIKNYIEQYNTNTDELKILARLLTYDLTRLQLLKESYARTLDRINYPNLVAVFDFEISKQSLLQFLSENEK